MTFDDDFMRLMLVSRAATIPVVSLGLSWPPPERIYLDEGSVREATPDDDPMYVMVRVSCSRITDDERVDMTHIARGALYRYASPDLAALADRDNHG